MKRDYFKIISLFIDRNSEAPILELTFKKPFLVGKDTFRLAVEYFMMHLSVSHAYARHKAYYSGDKGKLLEGFLYIGERDEFI